MTHFGLICPTAKGHLNPMTTIGYELLQRGHRVTWIGKLDGKAQALVAGLEFYPIGETEFPLGSTAEAFSKLGQLSGRDAFRYTIDLFKRDTLVILEETPTAFKSLGLEAVLIDQTSFGASSVAQDLELPFVSVCCALMLNREPSIPPFNTSWQYNPAWWAKLRNQAAYRLLDQLAKPIRQIISDYRQNRNLSPFRNREEAYSQLAQICQQPPQFEFPRQCLPSHFHFTGPYTNPASREIADFPFEKLTEQPLIYASLGTVQNRQVEMFQTIAAACQDLDVQLIIALGGGATPESMPKLPGNPLVVGYAPQLDILQRASLTITHAGMNTTLESLSQGVPMVAIPIANDQPGVASRIAWTGTGEVVPLKQLNVSRLKSAITRVMSDSNYKVNAVKIQRSIEQAGGVKRATDIIESVV